MLGYVTIGTNNLEKAKTYYDALLAELGGKRTFNSDRMQGYGGGAGGMIAVCTPHDGKPATVGNGTMFSLAAADRATVDKFAPGCAASATIRRLSSLLNTRR